MVALPAVERVPNQSASQTTPGAPPTVPPPPESTPTMDRLAAPPTAENPDQADEGAQLYWLHCQPCHGDRGQGLTDEWRAQYPPEDQNCWDSGCHGSQPYESGFQLPESVPAVIGMDSLARFESMGQVLAYIQAAMPFQSPGTLTDDEYLAILAFLARGHGLWSGESLDATAAQTLLLGRGLAASGTPEAQPLSSTLAESTGTGPTSTPTSEDVLSGRSNLLSIWLALGVLMATAGGTLLWRRLKE